MTAVWNLDHAIGGGMAVAGIVALILVALILFMVGACRAAARPRPLPRRGLPGCGVRCCISTHHCGPEHIDANGRILE